MYQRVGKGQAYRGCAQLALCVILDKQCMTTQVYFTRTRVMALHSRQNIITNLTVTAAHAPQHHDFSRVARQTLIFIKSLFTLCSRLYDRLYNRLDERFEYSYDEYINRVRVECCLFCDWSDFANHSATYGATPSPRYRPVKFCCFAYVWSYKRRVKLC